MNIDDKRLQLLLQKYVDNDLRADEMMEFWGRINEMENDEPLKKELKLLWKKEADQPAQSSRHTYKKELEKIFGEADQWRKKRNRKFSLIYRLAAAAIIIIVGSLTYLNFFNNNKERSVSEYNAVSQHVDVDPGKDGAILTLSDGSKIVLDDLENGIIATQNGTKIILDEGILTYRINGSNPSATVYNTVSTPKGRQFHLQLPDGSKVWLNAASSLRYPTVFTGKERKVEITGEAYFEVARNTKMPFHVKLNNDTEVEVLGTHFNINSYENEGKINTTLLEGSVSIINGIEKKLLKPGQQAQITQQAGSGIKIISQVDIDKVMAWKNGVFNFTDASLEEVMRQLERWYDIEIVYQTEIPDLEFFGKMGRDLTLTKVLRGLEMSKVHFRIEEGRRLVVLP